MEGDECSTAPTHVRWHSGSRDIICFSGVFKSPVKPIKKKYLPMENFALVDPHIHLWDIDEISYPWLSAHPVLNRNFSMSDYDVARGKQKVDAMIFVQSECDSLRFLDELRWVQGIADNDSRLQGIVPWLPLHKGDEIEELIETTSRDNRVKGVRQIIEFEKDPNFCIQPGFVRGVQLLAKYGLRFELTIDPSHFPNVFKLIHKCPDTRFILDHLGSPNIAQGEIEHWKQDLRTFASSGPHFCKFSNLVCNANLKNWTIEDLKPYADIALDTFGPARLMWASDWPHLLRASTWDEWFDVARELTGGLSDREYRLMFRENAIDVYDLNLNKITI